MSDSKIQILNCAIGCFNVKFVFKMFIKLTYNFVVPSNYIARRKIGHIRMEPAYYSTWGLPSCVDIGNGMLL